MSGSGIQKVFVTGATGFVGSHVLAALKTAGVDARCLVRETSDTSYIEKLGFETHVGNITDADSLDGALEGCSHIIHTVGIIQEKGGNTFQAIHIEGLRNLLETAKNANIQRIVHISAQGVREDGITGYQRTKWHGEQLVRESGLEYTILRPSLVFGFRSEFIDVLLDLTRKPLVTPVLGNGRNRFQPIAATDLARVAAQALVNPKSANGVFPLGGPRVLTFDNIIEVMHKGLDLDKGITHVPTIAPVRWGIAAVEAILPNPPVTVDQVKMLGEDNICDMVRTVAVFPGRWRDLESWVRNELDPWVRQGHRTCQRELDVPSTLKAPPRPVTAGH